MKFLPWIVFAVSVAILWSVFSMARGQDPMTPRQILEDVTTRLETGELTRQEAVSSLDHAISIAADKPKPRLLGDLHMMRGQVYFDMGGFGKAGEDFKRVLEAYRPGNHRAEAMLVDVEIEAGEFEAADERLRGILAQRPRDAQAWTRFGRLSKLTAQESVDECYASIDEALVLDEAEEARRLLLSIAARDPNDPSRVALIRELRSFFGDDDDERVRDILDTADRASRAYKQARTATARSLQTEIDETSATQMMELFAMADHHEQATRLGSLLLGKDGNGMSEHSTMVMLESYQKLEQHDRARSIINPWISNRGKAQSIRTEAFFRAACDALYRARAWPELSGMAGFMRFRGFRKETERLSNLYQGIAFLNRGEHDNEAIFALSRFFAGLEGEIFPNSRAIGYEAKAKAQRNLGDPGELESLLGVHTFDPECNGKINLRISRLMQDTPNLGSLPPLYHMTFAMSKMPKRTEELFPEWSALGEKEIATSSINLDVIYERLRETKSWVQSTSTSSYRMWTFGQRFLEDEEWVGLNASAKRALSTYPGFLPAVDQRIEAELQLGNTKTAIELVLDRIDRTGMDEKGKEWMSRIPSAGATNDDLLRLMQADPAHTARRVIASTMVEDREYLRALEFLKSNPDVELDEEETRLLIKILFELKRHKQAGQLIAELQEADSGSLDLIHLQLQNLILQEEPDLEEYEQAIDALLAHPDVQQSDLQAVLDPLMLSEQFDQALSLLEKIDHHVELRSGLALMVTAQILMLRGEFQIAEMALERADAFEASGQPELARIFQALDSRSWTNLALEAKRMRSSEFVPSGRVAGIVSLFAEDFETSRNTLAEELALGPLSLEWQLLAEACDDFEGIEPKAHEDSAAETSTDGEVAEGDMAEGDMAEGDTVGDDDMAMEPPTEKLPRFEGKLKRDVRRLLRGTSEHPRDPREALGLLLAFECPGWMPWARAKTAELPAEVVGPLWPLYFGARTALWAGDLKTAGEKLDAIHILRPEFVPAWDLHETVLIREFGSDDHPRIQRFLLLRAAALSNVDSESPESALAACNEAFTKSGPRQAVELSLEMVARFPEWAPGFANLAELQTMLGRHPDAFKSWTMACARVEPVSDHRFVKKMFTSLALAQRSADAPEIEDVFRILEALARHLPEDPTLALRLAELDIETEPVDPATGVERAFARLDRFRSMTDKSLNQLRPKAARKWLEFVSKIDTKQAEMLLQAEMLRRPGELDLWLLRGDILRAKGQLQAAIENCAFLLEMSRDVNVLMEQASLLAISGTRFPVVNPLLQEIMEKDPESRANVELLLIRTEALLNQPVPLPPNGLKTLRNLWSNRKNSADDIDINRLGYLYVTALLRSPAPGDRTLARRIIENLIDERYTDLYETPFFKSILGLTLEPEVDPEAETDGSD